MSGRRDDGAARGAAAGPRCTHRRQVRCSAPVALLASAVVVLVTGCGSPDLLDPAKDPLPADRAHLVEHMTNGLAVAADQLGAGEALATRVDTWCSAGEDNWKYTDNYRSTCEVAVYSGFSLDTGIAEAFGGIDGLIAFEERLVAAGWGGGGWQLVRNDPGVVVDIDHIREYDLPVTDVTGVRLYSAEGDGTSLSIGFIPATTPIRPANEGPPAGYYRDTRGGDWQNEWVTQRSEHAVIIAGRGEAVLAEQPW